MKLDHCNFIIFHASFTELSNHKSFDVSVLLVLDYVHIRIPVAYICTCLCLNPSGTECGTTYRPADRVEIQRSLVGLFICTRWVFRYWETPSDDNISASDKTVAVWAPAPMFNHACGCSLLCERNYGKSPSNTSYHPTCSLLFIDSYLTYSCVVFFDCVCTL